MFVFMDNKSIIAQLKTATSNFAGMTIGGVCGALVPVGTNHVTHSLLDGNLLQASPLSAMVFGGLVFSCLSVFSFSRSVFGSWYKALGFVMAIEGYMTFTSGWLSTTALVFLVAINLIANGCRVAAERQAELDAIKPEVAPVPECGLKSAVEAHDLRIAKLEAAPVEIKPVKSTKVRAKAKRVVKTKVVKAEKAEKVEASDLN